jgi:hypothetical protein
MSNKQVINLGWQCAPRMKRVPTDDQRGHRTVQDGWIDADVQIVIDVDKLRDYVQQAIVSKTGRCLKFQGGVIIRCAARKERSA